MYHKKTHNLHVIPPPSDEQQTILRAVRAGHSIIVDAVAGSGKTTTVLHIASAFINKHIVQITYNAKLKHEVRNQVPDGSKLEIHTYHSLGYAYYNGKESATDTGLLKIAEGCVPARNIVPFDIIIVDECQDMTEVYFNVLRHFYIDNLIAYCNMDTTDITRQHWRPQLIFIGDRYQCINGYKDADARYLTMADTLWSRYMNPNYNPLENTFNIEPTLLDTKLPTMQTVRLSLSVSYRLTVQLAWFVNTCLLHCPEDKPRIIAANNRSGPKVELHIGRYNHYDTVPFHSCKHISSYIINMLRGSENKAKPPKSQLKYDDIMIIMPSVKRTTLDPSDKKCPPWVRLVNKLTIDDIPVWVAVSDEQTPSDAETAHKVLVTTLHSSKGLGRKIVIAFNFDMGYFKYYNRDGNQTICPNIWYVAATRAKHKLILVGGRTTTDIIPFLYIPKDLYASYLHITDVTAIPDHTYELVKTINEPNTILNKHKWGVTTLIKFISTEVQAEITDIINEILIESLEYTNPTYMPILVPGLYPGCEENVSVINSDGVMEAWESRKLGHNSTRRLQKLCHVVNENRSNYKDARISNRTVNELKDTDIKLLKPADYLHTASLFAAEHEPLLCHYKQIANYNWLIEEQLSNCVGMLDQLIKRPINECHIEQLVYLEDVELLGIFPNIPEFNKHTVSLYGCVDMFELSGDKKSDSMLFDNTPNIDCVYEFKVKQSITFTDKLQLLTYAFMINFCKKREGVPFKSRPKVYKLFNALNGELFVLNVTKESMEKVYEIMCYIFRHKIKPEVKIDDAEFLSNKGGKSSKQLDELRIAELKLICKEYGIKHSKLRKSEIIAAITDKLSVSDINKEYLLKLKIMKDEKNKGKVVEEEFDELVHYEIADDMDAINASLSELFL